MRFLSVVHVLSFFSFVAQVLRNSNVIIRNLTAEGNGELQRSSPATRRHSHHNCRYQYHQIEHGEMRVLPIFNKLLYHMFY